jgi:hypothetical protein
MPHQTVLSLPQWHNTRQTLNQIHWPQPAYFPHPGIHYSVPNATHGATPGPSMVLAPLPVPQAQAPGLSACAQKHVAQDLGQPNQASQNNLRRDEE